MASTGSNITGNIWDLILARVETKVNQHIYSTWFKPTSFVGDDGKVLRVRVPNALFSNWLTKHYSVVIDEALTEVHRPGCAVSFVTEDSDPDENIQHYEQLLALEHPHQRYEEGFAGSLADVEHPCDGGQDARRLPQWRERHPENTVEVALRRRRGRLQREPRFSRASGAGQRE